MNEREFEHRITKVEEACAMIPKMADQMNEMSQQLAKYDGRWGTLLMVITAVWTVFVVFKDSVLSFFKGH